ncbi:esterase family protein [Winogradskyella sp. DF17]|uniref:Esterase family protein n=1 Tax=Winogradskyella pelagia TaxID=2819984 RepID=A0ABS3T4P5_9FLAO|nr:alpha/beta hydrolase-fold protein [Winogradskyella sp. DF17]MBO3117711.1 esterase family protein [Winogradskyella sp. DF17]
MKYILLLFISVFLIPNGLSQSKVLESLEVESKLLQTTVKYSVYLPEGFEDTTDKYPIVYLLNGFTGNETDWVRIGHVKDITDELIRGNKIEPLVIIMPDGDDRLYMNKDDGTYPYEDMFIQEFMPFVEGKYKIKSEKKYRGISGLSMGGSGSLKLALKYHTIFGACAGFSSGISTEEEIIAESQNSFDNYFGRISPSAIGATGEARLTPAIKENNIFELLKTAAIEDIKTVNIYFDCGDDDFLAIGNAMFHVELRKMGIPHEYRVRDGSHTWNFWVDSLPIGLEFISDTFRN